MTIIGSITIAVITAAILIHKAANTTDEITTARLAITAVLLVVVSPILPTLAATIL